MTKCPVKAYVFDMDGTLVDNCAYHVISWQKFSKAHGNTLSKKQILDWMGAQGSFYIEKIFGKTLPSDEVARLREEKESICRRSTSFSISPERIATSQTPGTRETSMRLTTTFPKDAIFAPDPDS